MSHPSDSTFVYVTFIKTTPARLWSALTEPAFTTRFWFGLHVETDWAVGSPWRLVFPDGRVADAGEIVEADPPRRLVLTWQNQLRPALTEEGVARCTMDLEPTGGAVKLTVTHTIDRPDSQLIRAVGGGWPKILSNLKSLLETGEVALEAM